MAAVSRVVIVDADPGWAEAFAALRDRILPAFVGMDVAIEHIGSTAVLGLAAKPVIDLVVVVPRATDVPDAIARLATLGYEHEGDLGVPGRETFRGELAGPAHHLYVSAADAPSLEAHRAFRDALRADPTRAAEYAELKRALADSTDGREAYTTGKTAFIERVAASSTTRPGQDRAASLPRGDA
jgi:GrpB-like predicted nucleotidyltransferase (UPF0157 family)